jgi:hypothetical protein
MSSPTSPKPSSRYNSSLLSVPSIDGSFTATDDTDSTPEHAQIKSHDSVTKKWSSIMECALPAVAVSTLPVMTVRKSNASVDKPDCGQKRTNEQISTKLNHKCYAKLLTPVNKIGSLSSSLRKSKILLVHDASTLSQTTHLPTSLANELRSPRRLKIELHFTDVGIDDVTNLQSCIIDVYTAILRYA